VDNVKNTMAAIYFDPEGYSISGPRLMGRNAAGHSFLRGYIRHNQANSIGAVVGQPAHGAAFIEFAKAEGVTKPIVTASHSELEKFNAFGTLYLPGPGLDLFARKRALYDRRGFSLCGITHTTLSARAMDAIAGLLTSPVEPWDALICTSQSVLDTVTRVLEAETDYLQSRLGATRFVMPRLPVISLGLNADDFIRTPTECAAMRQQLGITADEIVIVFVGRLSFHAKAHPAPMYEALQRVSANRKLTLIECGWFANDAIANAFAEAAAKLAPNIRRIVLDGRKAEARHQAWHAANIFMSLTDNLQETFGITPIEAMASGLPVIVSDWDGYRDTVRDGVDGFRVPTLMPKSDMVYDPARRYALDMIDYDYYCGETNHLVAVNIEATAKALDLLIENPALRQKMGETGAAYARATFDWSEIIRRYEDLWAELSELRQADDNTPSQSLRHPWPARMNPFESFASYPTSFLERHTQIRRDLTKNLNELLRFRTLRIYAISHRMLMPDEDIEAIFKLIPEKDGIDLSTLSRLANRTIADLTPLILFGLKTGCLALDRSADERQNIRAV
jgi:starch synthase